MLALEEILCELNGENEMNNEQGLPPGFRFHPTDEELITFYLASKVFNPTFSAGVDIAEVDLNRCEPWELPDVAKMGEREWYFFSLRDRKYPTGLRTNRATGAGYWKATGKDREVYSSSCNGGAGSASASNGGRLLGMKKTLVFYKGRAPRGEKTKWVMHEYRLDGDFSCRHTCKEEWVICRIFHKMGEKKNGVVLQGQSNHYMQEASITSSSPSKTGLLELQPHKPIQSLRNQNQNQNQFLINDHHHHHENDLKSLITITNNSSSVGDAAVSQAFPINTANGGCYQTSFSPTRNNKNKEDNTKQSPSSFFKSLLSNQQDYYYYNCPTSFKEHQTAPPTSTIIPKHCKTEPNFSHFDHFCSNDHNAAILRCPIIPPEYNNNNDNNYKIQQQNPTRTSYYQSPFLFGTMDTNGGFPSAAAGADAANLHEMSTSSSSSTSGVLAFNRAGFHQMLLDSSIKLAAGESWPFHF